MIVGARRHGFVVAVCALAAVLPTGGCRLEDRPTAAPDRAVVLLAIDGAEWRIIDRLIERQALPNLARIVERGAKGELRSLPYLLSPALWTTIATGVKAQEHGISGFTYRDERGKRRMVTSNMRRRRALWDILGERGVRVGVFGWLATWPAYPVNGYLASSYGAYVLNRDAPLDKIARPLKGTFVPGLPDLTYPPEAEGQMRSLMIKPEDLPADELARFADFSAVEPGSRDESLLSSIRFAYAADRAFAAMARAVYERDRPAFHTVYFNGVDVLSHRLWHFAYASPFPSTEEGKRRFGRAITEYYKYVDGEIGWYLDEAGADTTVIVCSDHGFQGFRHMPVGEFYSSATHRLQGVIAMAGAGVEPGVELEEADLFDITPTVLAIFGLPVAADMPGRILAEAFVPGYLAAREPIATYESEPFGSDRTGRTSAVDDAILERLRSLGYLDPGLPTAARSE